MFPFAWDEAVVFGGVKLECDTDLVLVVGADPAACDAACFGECGEEEADEECDDGNDDEELNESEACRFLRAFAGHGIFPKCVGVLLELEGALEYCTYS